MSTKELNALLQSVIDRSEEQKAIKLAKLREELAKLGYDIVKVVAEKADA